MSTEEPQPAGEPPMGDSAPAPVPPMPNQPASGVVPSSLGDVYYDTGRVILFTVVTFGVFGGFWTYRTSEDLKKYTGEGLGGVLGVVVYILLSVVLMFTIPNEIQHIYEREGRQSPVATTLGLWFLLPLVGNIIWYTKVQRALNELWLSKGARPA